jgi:hypothetical protein
MGSETWMNPNMHSSEIFPPNYDILRKGRKDGHGGVLGLKNDLIYEKLDTGPNTQQVFAKVTLDKNKTLIIGSIFIPFNSDETYPEDLRSTIGNIKNCYKNAVILIGRHLNLPDINWTINTVEVNQNSNRINKNILEVVESCNLHQMVTQPTKKTKNTTFTNCPTLTTRSTTLPGLGDHEIVFIESSA